MASTGPQGAQAQAASSKNPTPVHSEYLQTNEMLNNYKGLGLSPMVSPSAVVARMGIGSQVARRGRFNGHTSSQDRLEGSIQGRGRLERGSGDHLNPYVLPSAPSDWLPHPSHRPRPIPLPPPSSRVVQETSNAQLQPTSSDATSSTSFGNERVKPYSMENPYSSSVAERSHWERSPSPKRRKVDLIPERASPKTILSNKTREGVITSLATRPRPVSLEPPPPSPHFPEHRTNTDHATFPDKPLFLPTPPRPSPTQICASTVKVKREPESPPPLILGRKAVTSQHQYYPFPDDCKKNHPGWDVNRSAFRKEKRWELKKRGFKVIGKCITRDDGISLQWIASAPVWNDTLEPVLPGKDSDEGRTNAQFLSISDDQTDVGSDVVIPPASDNQAGIDSHPSDVIILSGPPSPASMAPAPFESDPRVPSTTSTSLTNLPYIASVSPSPLERPPPKRKRRTEYIPRAEMDLATAIAQSQQDNASPTGTPRRPTLQSSLRSTLSLATRAFHSLSPSVPSLPKPRTTIFPMSSTKQTVRLDQSGPKVPLIQIVKTMGEETYLVSMEKGTVTDREDTTNIVRRGSQVLEDASGWTVIKDADQSDRVGDEGEDDQLASEEEDENEMRDEMEAAEAINIGVNDDERGEEGEATAPSVVPKATTDAMPLAVVQVTSTTVDPVVSEVAKTDTDVDGLSRAFITKYMQMYETDRASLITAYAPDAKFIYRVCGQSQPMIPATGKTPFPLHTARGHEKISSSLHDLFQTHFSQTLDKDGNNKVDVEYWSESSSGRDIWLYVRSAMIVEESIATDQDRIRKLWPVDHTFLLGKTGEMEGVEGSEALKEDGWPVLVHIHQMVMHELPL